MSFHSSHDIYLLLCSLFVSGIWTNGHHIVSTGLDQCLRVWKIRVSGSGSDESPGHAVSLRQISSTVLEVAEPSALDVDCNERCAVWPA